MKLRKLIATALIMASVGLPTWAASSNGSLIITADELAYDGKSGKASANGSVVITKEDKTMVGASGWYNTKNDEAFLTGGVSMLGTNMSMAAAELHAHDNKQFNAIGTVRLQKDDRQIYGDDVSFNTETNYGEIKGNGKLIVDDNIITGDRIEAWTNRVLAKAEGNVTLHSARRNIDGSADRVTYTQTPGQSDGVAILTGNAHAVQNGNVLNAPELRLELKDNNAETSGGRSTLIITPK